MNSVSLVSRIGLGLVAAGFLLPGSGAAETRVGGKLRADATWTKTGSPYIATKDVVIPAGMTLRIEPGTTVRFKHDIKDMKGRNAFDLEMIVEGKLIAHGAEKDTIVFTSDAPKPRWTDWQGIVIQGEAAEADLRAVVVEYANSGILVQKGRVTARDLTVRFCHQHGFTVFQGHADLGDVVVTDIGNLGGTGVGVNLVNGSHLVMKHSFVVGAQNGIIVGNKSGGTLESSVISNCLGRGVVLQKADLAIRECTITRNDYGLILAGSTPTVERNNIFGNETADLILQNYRGSKPVRVALANNWWGFDNLGLVEERVLDAIDDPARGAYAVLEPILTEAIVLAPGETSSRP